MLYLIIMLVFALFAGIAMTVGEGIWSNAISLLCILLAGVIAVPWGLTLGDYVVAQMEPSEENSWAFVFASVWGVYFLAVTVLRVGADRASRVRLKFIRPLETAGGPVIGIFVAIMFVSFAACTLWIPITAGQWRQADASEGQKNALATMMNPFRVALKSAYNGQISVEEHFKMEDTAPAAPAPSADGNA